MSQPETRQRRLLLTFSAPSGAGKNTIINELTQKDGRISFFPTATTRAPRKGEEEGVHYYFMSQEQFKNEIAKGQILEWNEHYNNLYGTYKPALKPLFEKGLDAVSDLNWDGAKALKAQIPEDTVNFLILPPSPEDLLARFEARGKGDLAAKETKEARASQIIYDLEHLNEDGYVFTCDDIAGSTLADYDHVVVNENLDETVTHVLEIIEQERQKRGLNA